MDERARAPRRTKDARAVAWAAAGLGLVVIGLGVAAVVSVALGPTASGCKQMVGEVVAGMLCLAAFAFGLPHALLGALYLRRPARFRRWLLVLFALDVLAGVAQTAGFAVSGEFAPLLLHVPFALGAALAFAVVRRAPRERVEATVVEPLDA